MFNRRGSKSLRGSKVMDSDYKSEEESGSNSSNGRTEQVDSENYDVLKVAEESRRGPADVPTHEMLSDDFYKQDGEEQSDTYHRRESNQFTASNSGYLSRSVARKNSSRISKNANSYDNDGKDYNDEDEDKDGENDPDDADFDLSYGDMGGHTMKKGKGWDSDDSDEEDINISDEDDMDYIDNLQHKKHKVGWNSHS